MLYSRFFQVFISCLLFSNLVIAQTKDCIEVKEINIPFDGKEYTKNVENEDSYNYNLIYYTDEDEFSFWYKLNIQQDCKLKFSVLPSIPDDDYDFMLFKYANVDFCDAMVNNLVSPLSNTFYEPKKTENQPDRQITIANQKEINVKTGEVYYISVMNIFGEDCGHQLYIEACNSSIILNSVHKPCFQFSQPKTLDQNSNSTVKEDKATPINNENLAEEISSTDNDNLEENALIVEDSVKVNGFVRDNDDGKTIDAEIVFEDDVTGELFKFVSKADQGFNITLERSRRYRLKCSSLGYYGIKGVIEFLKPSTYDFYLLKIKEGENFVMENIYFYPSTYALKDDSYHELDNLVTYLKNNVAIKIEVQGHTAGNNPVKELNPSYKGMGEEWNYIGTAKKLSKLRAQVVKDYLVSKNISEERLTVVGFGADQKLIENPLSNEEKNKNMRVEIKVTLRERKSTEFIPSAPN